MADWDKPKAQVRQPVGPRNEAVAAPAAAPSDREKGQADFAAFDAKMEAFAVALPGEPTFALAWMRTAIDAELDRRRSIQEGERLRGIAHRVMVEGDGNADLESDVDSEEGE